MAQFDLRKFNYQTTGGNVYEVVLNRAADGSISGVGRLLGASKFGSSPSNAFTEVTFVVITTRLADAMGPAAKLDSYLAHRAMYDASAPGGAGALLSTLLT